jgi:CubicO group peptidase (beta-lactamase class C family)
MPKPVTGVALMILHEQGLWDFDDPVSKHVPELANLRIMSIYNDEGEMELVSAAREPNMRELLNHSTGFGYGLGVSDPVNNKFRDTKVLASSDLDDLIEKVADIPLLFQPGEQWSYSIAVHIQGNIVQKLSGLSFGDFLQQNIFQPLDMTDTGFYVKAEDVSRFAEVHNWDSERNRLVQRPHRSDRPSYLDLGRLESGGGGLVSSTHDYARFL